MSKKDERARESQDATLESSDCDGTRLSSVLQQRFDVLARLERGWDEHDADPVDPSVLKMARAALSYLVARSFPEPAPGGIGAVEDGRLDISWRTEELNVFCVLDTDEVCIHAVRRGQETVEKELKGDLTERTRALQDILVDLLSVRPSTSF